MVQTAVVKTSSSSTSKDTASSRHSIHSSLSTSFNQHNDPYSTPNDKTQTDSDTLVQKQDTIPLDTCQIKEKTMEQHAEIDKIHKHSALKDWETEASCFIPFSNDNPG